MPLCSSRMPNAARNRIRRGQKIRNGRISSTTNVAPVANFSSVRRQLRGVPGQRRRQRLGQKMIRQRRQIPPIGVAAQQLDDARHEHETEQQPAQQPDARRGGEAQQQREKPGLQQERVPLEGHEGLAAIEQREIEHIEQKQAEARQQIERPAAAIARRRPSKPPGSRHRWRSPEHHRQRGRNARSRDGSASASTKSASGRTPWLPISPCACTPKERKAER